MPKLSIIIPVFNTSKYLNKCLNSCLNQDIEKNNYEIVVVDDGSTDGSASIIKSYQEIHSNIIFVQKENGGVSSARNAGFETAKGEYILFVDSDDTIERNTLNAIVLELEKRPNQLIILNSIIYENAIKIREAYKFPQQLSGITLSGIELFKKEYLRGSVCGVVFEKQFILNNELRFSEIIKNGEDSLFMTMSFLHAVSVSHMDLDFYKVAVREESASQIWNYNKVKDMLNGLKIIIGFIEKKTLTGDQLAMLNIKSYEVISNAMFHFFSIHRLDKYFELKRLIKNSHLYPIKTYGATHFRFKIYLLNLSIDLFCFPFLLRQIHKDIKSYFSSLA